MIQQLKLDDRHFPRVINGEKSTTIRDGYRHTLRLGPLRLYSEQQHVIVGVHRIQFMALRAVDYHILAAEGYEDVAGLLAALKQYFPNIHYGSVVSVIHFNKP